MGISKLTPKCCSRARFTISDNLTAKRAASSRLSTGKIFIPEFAIRSFASSTFVPYKLRKKR